VTGLSLLGDVRVIDFTQALSGPYCTLMLADLGAEVTKVEPPGRGDDSRHWGPPFVGDDAAYFMSVNRNKRSVTLDLKSPDGLAAAHALTAQADVVVENWRPGIADRLGFSAAQLRATDPALVHCSISGFGQDQGPRSGYDQIVQGTSGVMSLTGPVGEPTKWGVPVGDIAAGMFASTAIVAALYERRTTGLGRSIDIAMQDCLVSMLTHQAARYLNGGTAPSTEHNGHATIAPYGLFRASDGFLNLCVGNDSQFLRMCQALSCPGLADDERFRTNAERLAHRHVLVVAIEEALAGFTVTDALATLAAAGVPAGRVRTVAQVLDDEATAERGMLLDFEREDSGPGRVVNTPWKFDGIGPSLRRPPPRLGEHTAELLGLVAVSTEDGVA
jgi:crotonobetainyl-CoA:carnitine CoA-transferase CaiB-like acyl-CoA transferase